MTAADCRVALAPSNLHTSLRHYGSYASAPRPTIITFSSWSLLNLTPTICGLSACFLTERGEFGGSHHAKLVGSLLKVPPLFKHLGYKAYLPIQPEPLKILNLLQDWE